MFAIVSEPRVLVLDGPGLGDHSYVFRLISGVDAFKETAAFRLLPPLAAACWPLRFQFRDESNEGGFLGAGWRALVFKFSPVSVSQER